MGTVRAAKQVREEAGIVALPEVIGYNFEDAALERTARVHSCVLPCFDHRVSLLELLNCSRFSFFQVLIVEVAESVYVFAPKYHAS